MAYTDFVVVEGFDRNLYQFSQLQPLRLCCVVAYVISSVGGGVITALLALEDHIS